MDSHLFRAGILLAATLSLGANYGSSASNVALLQNSCRSQHFVVSAPTQAYARQVCEAAERYRKELALEWLGRELPPWRDICPIQVSVGPHLGAGGATSFTFINGHPREWHMDIQGSKERILDSVLPHEITHTILATHFGQPLPRWADEGAATSVEHTSERSKQDRLLIEFLTTDRGIAFNHMFAMMDYPEDMLPLYSQGYSLARYLIARGGRKKYVQYVGDALAANNWTAATKKHYGMNSLSQLQRTWLAWVRQGSPAIKSNEAFASHTRPVPTFAAPAKTLPADRWLDTSRPETASPNGMTPLPGPITPRGKQGVRPAPGAIAQSQESQVPTSSPANGWYSRQRDRAQQTSQNGAPDARPEPGAQFADARTQLGRPQPPERARQIILEWSRADVGGGSGAGSTRVMRR